MKKIFKSLLLGLSSLLAVAGLTACSFFEKKEETSNQLVIEKGSFTNTYTTITFEFEKDINAIYYVAYFNGPESASLSRIEPSVEYMIPDIQDGEYRVFLKAFANQNYESSNPFLLGTLEKYKKDKSTENLKINASVNENYGIDVNLVCSENETTDLEVSILKDESLFLTKTVEPNSSFSTDDELPVGNYTISAFFKETKSEKQSEKVFYNGSLAINKRKIILSSFAANYERGKIKIVWETKQNVPCTKELTVSSSSGTKTYINNINGEAIKSGMILDGLDFGEGELEFSLKLNPGNNETYLESDLKTATVIVEKYRISSAPSLEILYDDRTGKITVDCPTFNPGETYNLRISCSDENIENSFFYDQNITEFPVIFEKANVHWELGTYDFSLKRKGTSFLELDSEPTIKSQKVSAIEIAPNVSIEPHEINGDYYNFVNIYSYTPDWINESWANGEYTYEVSFDFSNGNNISKETFNQDNNERKVYYIYNKMPKDNYHFTVRVLNNVPSKGYIVKAVSGTCWGGTEGIVATNSNLGSDFEVSTYAQTSYYQLNSYPLFVKLKCTFGYTKILITASYDANGTLMVLKNEPEYSCTHRSQGDNAWIFRMYYPSSLLEKTITIYFAAQLEFNGCKQILNYQREYTLWAS